MEIAQVVFSFSSMSLIGLASVPRGVAVSVCSVFCAEKFDVVVASLLGCEAGSAPVRSERLSMTQSISSEFWLGDLDFSGLQTEVQAGFVVICLEARAAWKRWKSFWD